MPHGRPQRIASLARQRGRRHKAALRSRATRDCLDHRRTLVSRARSCSSASPTSNRPSSPCLTSSATRAPASSPTLHSKSDAGKAVLTICANGRAVTRRSYLRGGEAALPQDLLTDGRPDPAQSRALGAAQSTALASRQVPASLNAPPSISPGAGLSLRVDVRASLHKQDRRQPGLGVGDATDRNAREASARHGAYDAPTRRGLPPSAIRWRRASGAGGVNRRSDRQRRSARALPSVAKA